MHENIQRSRMGSLPRSLRPPVRNPKLLNEWPRENKGLFTRFPLSALHSHKYAHEYTKNRSFRFVLKVSFDFLFFGCYLETLTLQTTAVLSHNSFNTISVQMQESPVCTEATLTNIPSSACKNS